MATDGESRIDPRYHPAFQRGFEPKLATERVREREFQPTIAEQAADLQAAGHRPDAAPLGPAPLIEVVPAMGSVEVVAGAEAVLARSIPRVRRANPYYLGLWIAGILSMVASGALASLPVFWNGAINQDVSSWMQGVRLAAYLLPGPLVTVGLAIIIGLVFMKASALRKGRA
jgi:hypothetical protein